MKYILQTVEVFESPSKRYKNQYEGTLKQLRVLFCEKIFDKLFNWDASYHFSFLTPLLDELLNKYTPKSTFLWLCECKKLDENYQHLNSLRLLVLQKYPLAIFSPSPRKFSNPSNRCIYCMLKERTWDEIVKLCCKEDNASISFFEKTCLTIKMTSKSIRKRYANKKKDHWYSQTTPDSKIDLQKCLI